MLALHRPMVRVELEDGTEEWVEVDPDVAAVMEQEEPPLTEPRIEGDFGSDISQFPDENAVDPLELLQYWEALEQWYLHPDRDPNAALPCWLRDSPFGLVIGSGVAWPPPELAPGETCEGCGGARLRHHAACLSCLDRNEAKRLRELQANEGAHRRYRPGTLAGGRGKAKGRKVKPAKAKPKRQVG